MNPAYRFVRRRSPRGGLAVCVLLAAGVTPGQEPPPGPANAGALRVNEQLLSVREVETLFLELLPLVEDKLRRGALKPAERTAAVRAAWTEALQTAAQDAILDQLGAQRREQIIFGWVRRADPGVPTQRIAGAFLRLEQDAVRELRRERVEAAGGEAELRAALQRKGQKMEDWEAGLRREIFRSLVLRDQLSPTVASPAAARAYYEAHPDEFRTPELWRLRRIRVPKARYASPENAAEAARLIYAKLKEGADFGQLAVLQSDPPFSAQGGVLTVNDKAELPAGSFPGEEAIAAKLKDGEFSEPIDAGGAFAIVKREGHRESELPSYADAQRRAEALSHAEQVMKKKREFFEAEKHRNYLEILCPDPPAKYLE